jgi:outer membrane protein assembly factor BamB
MEITMQRELVQNLSGSEVAKDNVGESRWPRLWFPITLVTLYWVLSIVVSRLEKLYFLGFLYGMASAAVFILVYFGWWWLNRRIRLSDRFFGFVLILAGGAVVEPFCHESIGWFGLWTACLPIVLTVWTVWLLAARRIHFARFRLGSILIVSLTWACFSLLRIEGVDSDLKADMHWRWTPTSEDLFLAGRATTGGSGNDSQATTLANWVPNLAPADWTGFRGPDRQGVIHGVTIATDWKTRPPRLVWRQRVGPAWSSVIVIDDRLFTQEQRGELECVVCYESATGKELWVHNDKARFWETVSGAGPRATPTFADGRIYTVGGTGLLNCLNADTGQLCWSRDIRAEAEARIPMWGYSSSPLVVDGHVMVFAGGEASLRAYQALSGDPVWTAEAGAGSYSSPQLTTVAGKPQILILSESGLSSFDPADGSKLWQIGQAMQGAPRTLQPHLIGSHQFVIGQLQAFGVSLIDVMKEANGWKVEELWRSTQMKPEFPDFVVHEGHAYGFDGAIFSCIDLSAGKRTWKGGRYGRGQVVLLAEQKILLVISETGEAILLAANPMESQELSKFQALNGKTWNHPVIAQDRLYLRNAEEMACYELQ